MTWFRNRTTATKLILGFSLLAVLAGVAGAAGLRGMAATGGRLQAMYDTHALGLHHLQEAHVQAVHMSGAARHAVGDGPAGDKKGLEQRIAAWHKRREAFGKETEKFKSRLLLAESRTATLEMEKAAKEMADKQLHAMELAKSHKLREAHDALAEARKAAERVEAQLEKLVEMKRGGMKRAADEAAASLAGTRLVVLGIVAGALTLALLVGVVIARAIARPLRAVIEVLQVVAQGDFTRTLEVTTTDEVGRLATALNQAVEGMRSALQEVGVAASHAASASQQLTAANERLSGGAQEQASSLEQTAASLEEITGTVKQNAENARQANQLAVGSRDIAEKGGQVVAEAVHSMTEINRSSKKIADIITTIDEIAFQTNLLALNAAVEAARAGEQGRGFAVVASEVRNLAQRSATAAKEIKGLIQDSVQKVEAGSGLVNQSGETLNEIVASVKRVTDVIAEIAAASQEQSSGIDQVNKAVTRMDQVTQSNAVQTEALSSTAQSLAAQAEQLQALVGRFKLDTGAGAPAVRRAAPRPSASRPAASPPASPAPRANAEAPRGLRKTDEPVRATVSVGNGKGHHNDDGFEEF